MTNSEKYLKEGVSVEEFVTEFHNFCARQNNNNASSIRLEQFLSRKVRPTLTEDERVILRNIDNNNYVAIGRKNDGLYLRYTEYYFHREIDDTTTFALCFPNLFQFIKERRRI